MRVLIFHGYLLGGTGSNVYNAKLVEALVGLGHEVHLLCQDRDPGRLAFVDAIGTWDGGELELAVRAEPARCTVYRPDIGSLLPVYVADRYPGIEARPFPDCSDEELDEYVARNVAAVAEVVKRATPDVALANHLIMGPLILARALRDTDVPYAVKVHGSALEYTVKPHPERFLGPACEGLAGARAVLVGSRHTAQSLWAALPDPELESRTRLGPPGVDVAEFVPRPAAEAAAGLRRLAGRLQRQADATGAPGTSPESAGDGDAFARDGVAAARAVASLDGADGPLVAFVGKLIVAKGVDLLLSAWPLVLSRVPDARLVVVGFGAFRPGLERLLDALGRAELTDLRALAEQGRALEGGPQSPLRLLLEFLDTLTGPARDRYLEQASRLPPRVVLTGRLEHAELADLLPACEALVFPSTFPEAFGMVAVEAAACGVFPISAAHSGLQEVTRALATKLPATSASWLSFEVGERSIPDLADRIAAWLQAPDDLRTETREALVSTARARYSWQGVARGVLAAAQGELDQLAPAPAD